jgi:hypothetical protein
VMDVTTDSESTSNSDEEAIVEFYTLKDGPIVEVFSRSESSDNP